MIVVIRCDRIMFARWGMIMSHRCEQFVRVVDAVEFGLVMLVSAQLCRDKHAHLFELLNVVLERARLPHRKVVSAPFLVSAPHPMIAALPHAAVGQA